MSGQLPSKVVVINDRSAMIGGASNLAILSARLIEARGIAVTFFSGDAASPEKPVADTINLADVPLTQQSRFSAFAGGLYNGKAYQALRQLIAERDDPSTVYHVHGWSKILSPAIFRALVTVRDRVVLHAHDYFLACPNGGFANYRSHEICTLVPMSRQCILTQCDKRGYHEKVWRTARHALREDFYSIRRQPSAIVTVHERMLDYFIRAGIDVSRVHTIRNPVEPFLTSGTEPWNQSPLFFIGRLEPEKGFADAAAAARLANAPLHVIGDGAGRALLERDYPEVVIHGWKSRDGIAALVNQARAVVVSSRVPEPFSLAALEAVASGIPVIVPSAALLGNEIAGLNCGLTFRSGNVRSLAGAMRQIVSDDMSLRQMSINCLREAPKLANTHESWGDALVELYRDVLLKTRAAGGLQAAE